MTNLKGPAVLTMPDKMLPIITEFNNYRYFLAEGGRGGAKTQAFARLLCYIAEKRKVRIFCGRETQNTIEESVYTTFKDIITHYKLNFKILSDRIIHNTTGSQIKFKGFREQGSTNIKGMEGVDIVWIDEAQAITKNTLDILIPTIRKEKAKIFFSMNRHLKGDPVFAEFHDDEDCLHIHINYLDNPFISNALLKLAEKCKAERPEDYEHIWLGKPQSTADNKLFNDDELDACLTREFPHDASKYGARIIGGDVARFGSNYSCGVVMKQCGPDHWEEEYLERWKGQNGVFTIGKFTEMINTYYPDYTIIDADGMGGPVYDCVADGRNDVLPFHGGQVDEDKEWKKKYNNYRTEGYLILEELVKAGRLRLKSKFIVDQLKEIRYKYDLKMRKIVIPKEQLIEQARKSGIPYESPDEADGVMMAITQAETVKEEQANMFTTSHGRDRGGMGGQTYASDSTIF